MFEVKGGQQSDAWLRARIGRITGSRIADCCSYLSRKSGDKQAGDPSATRDKYKLELISERLTGRDKDNYNSPAMQRGSMLEADARRCYAAMVEDEVEEVGFVLHPKYPFTGASADSLVGTDGVLEIKCLLPWNHLSYVLEGKIPEDYMPQIAWEMACAGRQWCDFVMYCPDIVGRENEALRFFYRRVEVSDLQWELWDKTLLEGHAVIDYFTSEVLKMEAEINAFMEQHGCRPIAPFPVDVIEADPAPEESGAAFDPNETEFAYLDNYEVTP